MPAENCRGQYCGHSCPHSQALPAFPGPVSIPRPCQHSQALPAALKTKKQEISTAGKPKIKAGDMLKLMALITQTNPKEPKAPMPEKCGKLTHVVRPGPAFRSWPYTYNLKARTFENEQSKKNDRQRIEINDFDSITDPKEPKAPMTEKYYKLRHVVRPSWPQPDNLKARAFEAGQSSIWLDNVWK